MKKIAEVMNPFPFGISKDTPLRNILGILKKSELSHLIVLDKKDNYLGIISKEDVLNRLNWILDMTSGETFTTIELSKTTAQELMTKDTVNLNPDDCLEYAAELLLQKRFHSLPVIDNNRAVGIITTYDLIKYYYEKEAKVFF